MKFEKRDIIIGITFLLIASAVIFCFYKSSQDNLNPAEGRIELYNLSGGQEIKSPLTIKGRVTGGKWIGFEGQVGIVKAIDSEGKILGSSVLSVASDWTKLPLDFETTLVFESPKDGGLSLVFYNENPSGISENNEIMSVYFKTESEKSLINIYFGKSGNNDACDKVFAVERRVEKTEAIAKTAIEELTKGPTDEEKEKGYFTAINSNAKVNKINIVDGTAKIDFDESLEEGVGGSCKVSEIRQQIIQTLMQFSTVNKVIISINGRTEDILQP